MEIGAIILAAGGSSRLGQPKQFLVHEGETLIRRAARAAIEGGCAPVVIVGGDENARILREVADLATQVVHHPAWQRGIGTSIRVGLAELRARAPGLNAVVVMVCDQPFVTASLIANLIARHAAHRSLNIACAYADTVGVPALFTRHFFRRLAALPDDSGARQLLAQWPHRTATIPFSNGAIDIDTTRDCVAHLHGTETRPLSVSARADGPEVATKI